MLVHQNILTFTRSSIDVLETEILIYLDAKRPDAGEQPLIVSDKGRGFTVGRGTRGCT